MDGFALHNDLPPAVVRAYYTVIAFQLWMAEQSYLVADPTVGVHRLNTPFQPPVDTPSHDDIEDLMETVIDSVMKYSERPRAPRTREMVEQMRGYLEDLLRADEEAGGEGLEADLRAEFEAQLQLYRTAIERLDEVQRVKDEATTAQPVLASRL